ncbi:D-isomer specific 2-hydroxyacid dehydrogenase [Aspergillus ambiguus]|uniref:D-mandelate dehydrogenase-like dehydrogenase n=1 Tax=Aspergillus ambiguus TaxID=176160 RepID=UPI003CCD30EC
MPKPIVLHIGEPIKYNHDFYNDSFLDRFDVVRNDALDRPSFMAALKERRYGDFVAIFRPHFQSGGEMGQWDEELINLLPPSVRIFASAGAGFNWADVEALGRRGIWYANGAGASDEAVSDTTLYMILSVFRNFTRSQLAARQANPEVFTATHKLIATISHNPRGHVLGLVGLGNISKKVAMKAKAALGMEVHYFDILRQPLEVEQDIGVTYHDRLDDLLKVADCVSLHTPLNQHTKHLINRDTLKLMKPGARLINTARGEVVEEDALIEALETGAVSAAGLDVHYHEPQVSPRLAAMENVTMTTHIGGGALDTRTNFELNAMKNIMRTVGTTGQLIGEPFSPVNKEYVRDFLDRQI